MCDWSLLRGLGGGDEGGQLQLRVMSDASVASNGACAIGILALVRHGRKIREAGASAWERDEVRWLGGDWDGWRPFCVGAEAVQDCTVATAELLGIKAAVRLAKRIMHCLLCLQESSI